MSRDDHTAGFAISTYDQLMIEDNAESRFNEAGAAWNAIRLGFVTKAGKITKKGFEQLSEDISRLERNGLTWLRKNFRDARDEGHDVHDDLIGTLWYDPTDQAQLELLELGQNERIDMVDSSWGDFAKTAFTGVSDLGVTLLGGQINFFDTEGLD